MTFDGSAPATGPVAFDEPIDASSAVSAGTRAASGESPPRARPAVYCTSKRGIDVLGALAIGLAFGPFMIFIAACLGWRGEPILFRHLRVGKDGRIFECLKFRTMVVNAEQQLQQLLERDPLARLEWAHNQKLRTDPRVTRLGRFLRRSSLDELPQLWNVLRGQMSLVGPRPIVAEEMHRYGRHLRSYLTVRPGVTGLWQVAGRNDTGYRRRVIMDVCYVRKMCIGLDLKILLQTVKVVIAGRGAY
ncbi:MAG: sugar transferase [Gammaproteobacteria bacterium]|nr:sugar transferase [Gammaproteobacteria bacterium]